jgi:hypothetical protein
MAEEISSAVKAEIIEEIKTHIRVHGSKDWGRVRERFPNIIGDAAGPSGHRRFYRWLKSIQAGKEANFKEAVKTSREKAARHLPVAPPPSYVAANGASVAKNIDFLVEIATVWQDAMMLRNWSVRTGADGQPMVKNPRYLMDSIRTRLDTMETAMKIMHEVWDLQKMEDFYAEIIAIISEEMAPYPDAQGRVLDRLKALNDKRAMTVHAEPSH